MTLQQLNQHAELRRQLAKAERLRESLRAAAEPGAQVLTGMPHAPGYQNKLCDLAAEIADLSNEIARLRAYIREREPEIADFINSIWDGQTRTIFRLRFLRGMGWGDIARAIGGGNTASSVRIICHRYLKKRHIKKL